MPVVAVNGDAVEAEAGTVLEMFGASTGEQSTATHAEAERTASRSRTFIVEDLKFGLARESDRNELRRVGTGYDLMVSLRFSSLF